MNDTKVIPDTVAQQLLYDGLQECARGALILYEYLAIESDAVILGLAKQIHDTIKNKNLISIKKS